jgi:hypothetical protein
MVPPFDIFKRQRGGSVRWFGVAVDFEAAKARVQELEASDPGEYFIFSLATGHRVFVNSDNPAIASPAKNSPSEPSKLGNAANLQGSTGAS